MKKLFFLAFSIMTLNACSLLEISQQIQKADSIGHIKGIVQLSSPQQGNIIVHRYYLNNKTYISNDFTHANKKGEYQFNTLPGTYYLAAYLDNNHDGEYQVPEYKGLLSLKTGQPAPVTVQQGQITTVPAFSLSKKTPQLNTGYTHKHAIKKPSNNIGKLTALNNPLFNRDNYSIGMWKPIQFIEQVGAGLFFLENYQADKIPVLFIHGINGGPLDWQTTIESLDRNHFQPWLIYYPSGLRLNIISDYLITSILHLQNKYQPKHLFIVAHSMGGLVARSTLKKYHQQHPASANSIKLLMTINSPLSGMVSAGKGVDTSPIILPVWRDLAPNSEFLADLNQWKIPSTVPYHLVFSYLTDSSGDGIVSIENQIPLKMQQQATRIYGFNNSHTGTLRDKSFLKIFNHIIEEQRLQIK